MLLNLSLIEICFLSLSINRSHGGDTSILGMEALELLNIDSLGGKVLVALKWVVGWVPVPVWWSRVLLEGGVLVTQLLVSSHLPLEVSLGEETVRWAPVVVSCWLVIVEVREAGSVGVGEVEWHVGETVIDTVELLALHEGLDVVLDNWALSEGGVLGSSGVHIDGITEGEDVVESRVLEGVWVHVN